MIVMVLAPALLDGITAGRMIPSARLAMFNMRPEEAVASTRHTIVLLFALLAISIWGAIRSPISEWPAILAGANARPLLYGRILALQCLWVVYVWLGMRHSAISLRALIDDSRWTALRWLRYLAIGAAGWLAYLAIEAGVSKLFHPNPAALLGLQSMFPHSPVERMMWAAFAVTAGVCEEVVYRGYLLWQFRALTGNTFAAVILQALCYGLVHLVLPIQSLAGVVVLGLLLGGLAVWQKSLVPGMILHTGVGLIVLVQPA